MTTAICFDFDGTLVEFERDYAEILRDAITEHADYDAAARYPTAFVAAYDEAFYEALKAVEPTPVLAGACAVFEAAGVDGDPAAFARTLRERELRRPSHARTSWRSSTGSGTQGWPS